MKVGGGLAEGYGEILRSHLGKDDIRKLMDLDNPTLHRFVADGIGLCNPADVFVVSDSPDDTRRIRRLAVESREELPLAMEGHTVHVDGYFDQGRDKEVTRYLVPPGLDLGERLNCIGREAGLAEVRGYLKDSMAGRTMFVRFFSLGPVGSDFAISGVQLTDSSYVCHSEDLLYRSGYEQFKSLGSSAAFFRVLHSSGRVDGRMTSVDVDRKRIYIDIEDDTVYSVNTQYAGNTVGFKKLSLRLAIRRADREGWLAEHMLLMGAHGPGGRVTYFTGAFPSYCGKTSTAMIPGETIIGDDLAYLRRVQGAVRAVNVENGIFGVIKGINPKDDPVIWDVLNRPGEVIFSNVLAADGVPYWVGGGRPVPEHGVNYAGDWHKGMVGPDGAEVQASHANARFTVRLSDLENLDPCADDPAGVEVGGIIYGGRDSDTLVPVQESRDWVHGVITMGAGLESETTAATLGKAGVRSFQPMSNLDFVSIRLGRYIQNHLDFAAGLKKPPRIYGVNYFITGKDGAFLTGMKDKYVWLKWMELRCHGDAGCITLPTGCIPLYDDLKRLFKEVLAADYTREQYIEQFSLRIPENLAKLDRIEKIYRAQVSDSPQVLFDTLAAQRRRLEAARKVHGDHVSPFAFAK